MDADEVLQRLFEDDFSLSEGDSSDDDGEGIFGYAGQQHFDNAELESLSSRVAAKPDGIAEPRKASGEV